MMKKYEILKDQSIECCGHTLYRIQALKDFSDVKAGDIGGWIESEDNLSQEGDCWIYDNALVCGNVRVFGNARVCGNVLVCENALVYENALVSGNAEICGDAAIRYQQDYIVFKNTWSSEGYFTWTKSNNMWKAESFYGSGKELIEKAYNDSELSGKMYEAYVRFVENLSNINK